MTRTSDQQHRGIRILSLSIHGLMRAREMELGSDPDTGGQISYVIDEARALARHERVESVEVVTRQVFDRRVDDDYAEPHELIGDSAFITRIPFGPRRYLKKESLWPHLSFLLDHLTRHVRASGAIPDLIHGHYADGGYVGAQLAKLLGLPFVFTGHSLGRVKQSRLFADGQEEASIEDRFRFSKRIEAEERILENAAAVIASTHQEVEGQYQQYDHYQPGRMHVIPPGVDLSRFSPPVDDWSPPPFAAELDRFLQQGEKPMILAVARPDERKNFPRLIRAFAETAGLREKANLVIIAGNRDDIRELQSAARRVMQEILEMVDRYDLYGSVAVPKHHDSADIPDLFRMATRSGGVFVNPALTEPFGLTLIEAGASGLPVVATDDGGPKEIIGACHNGILVDPMDHVAIGQAIATALDDRDRWQRWSDNGLQRVHEEFSWEAHANRYVEVVAPMVSAMERSGARIRTRRLRDIDRMLVTDVDDTLTGDDDALAALRERLSSAGDNVAFAIATGRTLERCLETLPRLGLPSPDVLITASGTELHYGAHRLTRDRSWENQISYRWSRGDVQEVMSTVTGLEPGPAHRQTEYRLNYLRDPRHAPGINGLRRQLRKAGIRATVFIDHETSVEVIPVRASPGTAIRFLCFKWNLDPGRLLVAGDSGNDADMLSGDPLGVVVGNHTEELEYLREQPRVYFASGNHAWGVLEGMDHYNFLGEIRIPEIEGDAKDRAPDDND